LPFISVIFDCSSFLSFKTSSAQVLNSDPKNKHLTKNVVFKTEGHEVGIPHFYATKADIQKLLVDFEIINFEYKEEY